MTIRYYCEIFTCNIFPYVSVHRLRTFLVVKWCYIRVISLMFACVSTWLTERLLPAKRGNYATEGCVLSQLFAIKTVNAILISYWNWIQWDIFRDFAYFCHPRPFAIGLQGLCTSVHDIIRHWYEIRMTLIFGLLRLFNLILWFLRRVSTEWRVRASFRSLRRERAM